MNLQQNLIAKEEKEKFELAVLLFGGCYEKI